MFKGLSGLKKAVKGGFSAVQEHSSQLAEQVVGDPSTSKDNLKESIKKRVQGGVASVVDASGNVLGPEAGTHKEKASDVARNIKHYGAFTEDYLGYADPTKDLRKAVKEQEKAAKKARKDKKKKTGKKEDLFDPENIAKYKREIEERKRREAEAQKAAGDCSDEDNSDVGVNENRENLDLQLVTEGHSSSERETPIKSPVSGAVTPQRNDKDNWTLFQNLTSGVDHLIQKTKDDLVGLKQESYFKKKEPEETSDTEGVEKSGKDSKRKWVDLDRNSFDDFDGEVSGDEENKVPDVSSRKDSSGQKPLVDSSQKQEVQEKQVSREPSEEEEPLDPDDDDDLFNTAFVDAITSGDVKLVVIPDDPVQEEGDDPFNTDFANEVVKKQEEYKRREVTKLKFSGLSSVADVLSGKADKVDKSLVDVTVKRKRRRANRINLIADDNNEVTALEDIATHEPQKDQEASGVVDFLSEFDSSLPVPEGDLLATSPLADINQKPVESKAALDLSEFEEFGGEVSPKGSNLTSNVAILSGEFAKPAEEEEDDFDAAFDVLAKESVTKTRLEELEKQFENDDIFDTSNADKVLKLASLIDPINKEEEEITFEDPFDTSAYDSITGDVETELEFESLAQRETPVINTDQVVPSSGGDAFGGTKAQGADEGWAKFGDRKPPPRPQPPRPRPARPPPSFIGNALTEADAPGIVVKAPSTESIKSWNISVAENLIKQSEDAVIAQTVLEEEEFDPFDTNKFDAIVQKIEDDPFDTKEYDNIVKLEVENAEDDIEDPFDTSHLDGGEPQQQVTAPKRNSLKPALKEDIEWDSANEEEEVPDVISLDLLSQKDTDSTPALVTEETLAPTKPEPVEVDPFDTDFAADVLPDKGDPFDTSYVKHGPGKAELKALEEEFLTEQKKEKPKKPKSKLVPGIAGRARPKGSIKNKSLPKVQAPEPEPIEDDPFDTSIADKLITDPVSTALPTQSTNKTETPEASSPPESEDPFDTTAAEKVIAKDPAETTLKETSDEDDFDPRA
ncbi:hypothetical protein TCAL_03141 [Tigriopus californicus]|uniref:Protein stoned-A n=1 Tax=Tigriopus californicus TaxID=6832 RepID=A0A553P220_TIGCA|nr:protein stoned-A-like [Tigriopus californicus]XP_059087704.1 protein stoned-A-like [Tigriopus californicus]TRY71729.1 hypothetical protein TCAL_03141 [Tigriopus californicus]|eukprot:TCALIF_03141-PA protein Name:"Similar to stnA Protein stoned-A (Drosophila melanogaster)" AED:0.51 eAED:0.68 QI:0/-1/0/1/-1/1/1/0/1019